MKNETKTPELKPSDSYIATKYEPNDHGYTMLYIKDYKFISNNKLIGEHRYNIEITTNKFLTSIQQVHHINEIKTDNQVENLMVFKNNCDHIRFHGIGKTENLKYNDIDCEWYYTDSETPRYCKLCGKLLTGMHRFIDIYCSKKCVSNSNASKRPPKEQLINLISKFHTTKAIAKHLETYPNTVYHWCSSYEINNKLTKINRKSKCPSLDEFINKAKICENNLQLSKIYEVSSHTIKNWWNKLSLNSDDYYCANKYKTNFLAKSKLCKTDTELAKLLIISQQNVHDYWKKSGLAKLNYYMK